MVADPPGRAMAISGGAALPATTSTTALAISLPGTFARTRKLAEKSATFG
jgi:hypothetical protein